MPELLPLLSAVECERALERVRANRAHWTARIPGLPFFTLGAASYLDAEPSRDAYYEKAQAMNPLLDREFGWLYERILEAIARHLGTGARLEPRAARPGFHVFLPHAAFARPLGKVHFDLQYMHIDWPDGEDMDVDHPVSYTIAIRLPRAGSGLCTWNVTKARYDAMTPKERDRIGDEYPFEYIPYKTGKMLVHSGMVLHRIAPARGPMRESDMRVTLQGHALRGCDGYRLYW